MEPMRIPEWTLGERLAKARKEAGLTQEEMADELDVSHSTIAKWEVNRGQPRGFMLRIRQWADLTGVPEAWLLGIGGSEKRGSSTPRKRNGPGRDRLGGTRPGRSEFPASERMVA